MKSKEELEKSPHYWKEKYENEHWRYEKLLKDQLPISGDAEPKDYFADMSEEDKKQLGIGQWKPDPIKMIEEAFDKEVKRFRDAGRATTTNTVKKLKQVALKAVRKEKLNKLVKAFETIILLNAKLKVKDTEWRDKIPDILEAYSKFLEKYDYMDTDWWSEEPTALDRFKKELEELCNIDK